MRLHKIVGESSDVNLHPALSLTARWQIRVRQKSFEDVDNAIGYEVTWETLIKIQHS